ncbi:MAG: hypothetical protein CM1200mP28_06930 [Deltaproteobacteria bacterium]|nr:MAG: hypothetical protein CM1200mP28_06930 [Deltaproteobacteria bacterium]
MVDQIHTVQQRISHLETGASNSSAQSIHQSASKQIPSMTVSKSTLPASGLSDPLGRPDLARTLEREMQMASKGKSISGSAIPVLILMQPNLNLFRLRKRTLHIITGVINLMMFILIYRNLLTGSLESKAAIKFHLSSLNTVF